MMKIPRLVSWFLVSWLRSYLVLSQRSLLLVSILCLAIFDSNIWGEESPAPQLLAPNGIVRLPDGSLLVSDIEAHRIFRWDAVNRLQLWGGTGEPGWEGDGQHVSQAALNGPHDLKYDSRNNAVLIADSNNHRIRKVDLKTMTITTIAGNGNASLSGDGGLATQASLNNPQGIALDRAGNMLIADTYNHVVRRVALDGSIHIVAGSNAGLSGDGGPATSAEISLPMAVAYGSDDRSFFVSDAGNSRIRRVSSEGIIETVCGIGKGSDDAGAGFSGDGDLATKAKIFSALDVAVVSPNFFYLSDSGNHRIRSVVHGVVVTVAGQGHPGADSKERQERAQGSADGSKSVESPLFVPAKMALAPEGGLYFCDRGNRSIRLLTKDGKIETISLSVEVPGRKSDSSATSSPQSESK